MICKLRQLESIVSRIIYCASFSCLMFYKVNICTLEAERISFVEVFVSKKRKSMFQILFAWFSIDID
jgi:hypothetical protein